MIGEVFCGFKWHNNSCALDTLATLLLHLYDSSTERVKELISEDVPFLAEQFARITVAVPSSWTQVKQALIEKGYSGEHLAGRFGKFISIVALSERFNQQCITSFVDREESSEYLIHNVKEEYLCHTYSTTSRNQLLKQSIGRDLQLKHCDSFQHCIDLRTKPFEDAHLKCNISHCKLYRKPALRQHVSQNKPNVIFHLSEWPLHENFVLNETVIYQDRLFSIFGAIYQKGERHDHFIARFKRGGMVYHYDGMHKMTMFPTCVPCTALDSTAGNMFPTVIPHKVNGIGPIRFHV